MKKSEIRRIEAKKREWDESLRGFNKQWKHIKRMLKKAMDWYWFNNSKSDGSKVLHLILWGFVTMGIIGWLNLVFGGR